MKLLAAALLLGLCMGCAGPGLSAAPLGGQQVEQAAGLNYLLYLPQGYDQQEQWPLVLFLHGSGERGEDLSLVAKHGPPAQVAAGRQLPFVLVSPQQPEGAWWNPEQLDALVDAVLARHRIDPDRIYVTGLSMGGYATWALLALRPDRYAAGVPICGGGDPAWAPQLARTPLWVFHGADDPVVAPDESTRMVDAVRAANGEVRYTLYPGVDHLSWIPAYNDHRLYDWLLAQRRQPQCTDLAALAWLQGTWHAPLSRGRTRVEQWWPESQETWTGFGATREADGQLANREDLRLLAMDRGVYYLAKVPENPMPVPFKARGCSADGATFINTGHDFPQVLDYRRSGDRLQVQVRGTEGEGFNLDFQRQP